MSKKKKKKKKGQLFSEAFPAKFKDEKYLNMLKTKYTQRLKILKGEDRVGVMQFILLCLFQLSLKDLICEPSKSK